MESLDWRAMAGPFLTCSTHGGGKNLGGSRGRAGTQAGTGRHLRHRAAAPLTLPVSRATASAMEAGPGWLLYAALPAPGCMEDLLGSRNTAISPILTA